MSAEGTRACHSRGPGKTSIAPVISQYMSGGLLNSGAPQ